MELLFRRNQTQGLIFSVSFKLWGKVEFDEEETHLVYRYNIDKSILVLNEQPHLLEYSVWAGLSLGFIASLVVFSLYSGAGLPTYDGAVFAGMIAVFSALAGYWYFHARRETIYMRDLMRGQYFSCKSVVALAQEEAKLEGVAAYLRQVMETAKHWDGTQRLTIEALPKEEARRIILSGL